MACCAGLAGLRVIHPRRFESGVARPMTIFTGTAGRHVNNRLALGIHTIVTISTATKNRRRCAGMIERPGRPGRVTVAMAGITCR